MKYKLKKDNKTGAYFLDYYMKKEYQDRCTPEELAFSLNIYKFKNYTGKADRDIWQDFTSELMGGVVQIIKESSTQFREVHMVNVPGF